MLLRYGYIKLESSYTQERGDRLHQFLGDLDENRMATYKPSDYGNGRSVFIRGDLKDSYDASTMGDILVADYEEYFKYFEVLDNDSGEHFFKYGKGWLEYDIEGREADYGLTRHPREGV